MYARADFTDFSGLLQQQYLQALLGQGLGGGQSAYATADDDDRLSFWGAFIVESPHLSCFLSYGNEIGLTLGCGTLKHFLDHAVIE